MRAIKFCGILMTCVLALLLMCHTAGAGKPERTPPGHRETFPSHAVLADGPGFAIVSDTGNPYLDTALGGDEEINITTDKTIESQLTGITFKIVPWSIRRAVLKFNVDGEQVFDPKDTEAKLLYDLLVAYETLDDDVRMGVWYRELFEGGYDFEVGFIVEDINREALAAEIDTEKYRFSVGGNNVGGDGDDHLVYFLRYGLPPSVVPDGNGWTIEPSGGVTLCVQRRMEEAQGNSGKTRPSSKREDVPLATYAAVSFHLTVIAGPPPPPAPRRHRALSSTWGKLKAK